MIHYFTPAGVVFENSVPEKIDIEWEEEAEKKYKNEKQEGDCEA